MLFRSSLLALLSAASLAHVDAATDLQKKYPQLGINSLDELSYNFDVTVDENCDYHFTVDLSHNENFPIGGADTCVPGVNADDYDGLPMLAGRWFYEQYPDYVKEATGMDHLSLDFNPCGREYSCCVYLFVQIRSDSFRFMVYTNGTTSIPILVKKLTLSVI
jgi:hypothetical protein